jgi:hypothetical protein
MTGCCVSHFCFFRYMFFFQVPVLPQLYLRADDLVALKHALCGRDMGAKPGAFTAEDIEAYKYTFATYGMLIHQFDVAYDFNRRDISII